MRLRIARKVATRLFTRCPDPGPVVKRLSKGAEGKRQWSYLTMVAHNTTGLAFPMYHWQAGRIVRQVLLQNLAEEQLSNATVN